MKALIFSKGAVPKAANASRAAGASRRADGDGDDVQGPEPDRGHLRAAAGAGEPGARLGLALLRGWSSVTRHNRRCEPSLKTEQNSGSAQWWLGCHRFLAHANKKRAVYNIARGSLCEAVNSSCFSQFSVEISLHGCRSVP